MLQNAYHYTCNNREAPGTMGPYVIYSNSTYIIYAPQR